MSTVTLLICATWLRSATLTARATMPDPSGPLPAGRVRHHRRRSSALRATARKGPPIATPYGRTLFFTLAKAVTAIAVVGLAPAGSTAARAQDAPAARGREPAASDRTIGAAAPPPCVVVDIAGHRAGHLDCATQRLTEAAREAQRQAGAARDVQVSGAGSPDVQVGVASQSGTRLRLGPAFGSSVRRPAAPPPVNPNAFGRRP
jgi:hypothetical protein